MTTRPKLRLGSALAPGLLAVGLFAVMALVVLNTPFGSPQGFPGDLVITAEIGYALLDLSALQSEAVAGTEPFLAALLLVAILLDAALDAALVLAKREEAGEPVTALSSTPSDSAAEGAPAGAAAADGGARTDGGEDA
ncbi:hypothetical protein [Salinilacihabitans rarus]|uniref:hypothetical protein n=1 Tax=Salinilacihabitans rarus TaxID=2961596 RepID=UPI0020C882E4|nr:hypothetical protein [Salinilacihabitans rarus]